HIPQRVCVRGLFISREVSSAPPRQLPPRPYVRICVTVTSLAHSMSVADELRSLLPRLSVLYIYIYEIGFHAN
ncbi:hypothetical protein EVAR_55188_1, partial [Eumeta japonica]